MAPNHKHKKIPNHNSKSKTIDFITNRPLSFSSRTKFPDQWHRPLRRQHAVRPVRLSRGTPAPVPPERDAGSIPGDGDGGDEGRAPVPGCSPEVPGAVAGMRPPEGVRGQSPGTASRSPWKCRTIESSQLTNTFFLRSNSILNELQRGPVWQTNGTVFMFDSHGTNLTFLVKRGQGTPPS